MHSKEITNIIKNLGFKITRARSAIVDAFMSSQMPLSAPEIILVLKHKGLNVNKTTVYREIDFLVSQNLIKQIDLRERGKKYEFNHETHHHHLVCIKCKNIQDFKLDQDLELTEKAILAQKNFKVLNHSLEFFGICKNCQD